MSYKKINLKVLVGLDREVEIPDSMSERVPPPAKLGYVIPVKQAQDVCRWWFASRRVQSLNLVGPAGCGKTSLIFELASRFNWPLYSVRMNATLRPEDLEGSPALITGPDGASTITKFVPGNAIRAYKDGGVLLLDEGNRAHPATHSWLNAMVEGYPITLMQTGEVVYPHDDFRAIMTGNAGFQGDSTGAYVDSQPYCVSYASRFRTIVFDYPTEAEEVEIVKGAAPRIPQEIAAKMVSLGRALRAGAMGATGGAPLAMPFQVRHLEAWAIAADSEYSDAPISEPLGPIYVNAFDTDDRKAVQQLIGAKLDKDLNKSLDSILKLIDKKQRDAERARAAAEAAAATAAVPGAQEVPETKPMQSRSNDAANGTFIPQSVPAAQSASPTQAAGSKASGTPARGYVDLASSGVDALINSPDDWTLLHCDANGHDKVYFVFNRPVPTASGGYARVALHGARGGKLRPAFDERSNMQGALASIRLVVSEKTSSSHKDGYAPAVFSQQGIFSRQAVEAIKQICGR